MPLFTCPIHEFNPCHNPAGSSQGGQFCSTQGRSLTSEEGYQWHETGPGAAWAAKTITTEDIRALSGYAGFGYSDINRRLRGTFVPNTINEFVRAATKEEYDAARVRHTDEYLKKYGHSFGKDVRDFDPDDPHLRVADAQGNFVGRLVHNVFYRPPGSDEVVEYSVQRPVPDLKYVAELDAQAAQLNATIGERGLVLSEPLTVHRAAYIPGLSYDALRELEGKVVEEQGFTSTMLGDAEGRLDGYVQHGKYESLYKRFGKIAGHEDEIGSAMRIAIILPKGTKVASVEAARRQDIQYARDAEGLRDFSKPIGRKMRMDKSDRSESEILLGSGARFRIIRVRKGPLRTSSDRTLKPLQIIDVTMEYVGGGSSEAY